MGPKVCSIDSLLSSLSTLSVERKQNESRETAELSERVEELSFYAKGLQMLLAVANAERDHYRGLLNNIVSVMHSEEETCAAVINAVEGLREENIRPLRRKALDAAEEVSLNPG